MLLSVPSPLCLSLEEEEYLDHNGDSLKRPRGTVSVPVSEMKCSTEKFMSVPCCKYLPFFSLVCCSLSTVQQALYLFTV